ncbi:MAG: DNA mismatch repair endonuclease MutL [Treponema sp.]|nr:DNA mismatch repair endonuclease MutL [Treponema sp.]
MPETSDRPHIKVLPPEEARRIAAGEVIDRPAALIREFLDNAIDAGAANIEVSIEEGGCKKIETADDGEGMSREDLELCALTHATSKIRGLDDLDTSLTLGFRGEALAAASAVARLEIVCSTDGREAWRLETGPGDNHPPKIEQTRRTKGATVRALNLFESIPARKRFMKREGSEATLCRQAFIDKALAFPAINFRFIQDGKLKDFFPAVPSKKERFAAAISHAEEAGFLHEINVMGAGFSAAVVIGGPELYRNDRRQLFVFANGRRVQEYSLVQAMEYGAQGWFPNGTHPVGAVYVEIDPALADFNIHPAKREVRFRDPGAIHHAVTSGLRNFLHSHSIRDSRGGAENTENAEERKEREGKGEFEYTYSAGNNRTARQYMDHFLETARNIKEDEKLSNYNSASPRLCENSFVSEPATVYGQVRYAGRVFGLFILIEWGDKLYLVDQHAAHERILYNRFLSQPIPKQELLAPIPFRAESDDDDKFLEAKREELSRLGVDIEKDEDGWRIEALPADWRLGDAATVKEILELRTAGENMAERWAATLCCRAALKDGDYPDDETAFALGKEALDLPDPRCPHGRPIWTEISKDALFRAVRRK